MIVAYAIVHKQTRLQWNRGNNLNIWNKPHHAIASFNLNRGGGARFKNQDVWVVVELVEKVISEESKLLVEK